jgi:hypothetical protein
MTKERDPLHLEGFNLDPPDFTIDLGPLDLVLPDLDLGDLPDLDIDLDSLDGMLNFDLDGIGTDFDGGILRTSINARGRVLAAKGNFLTSLRARDMGSYRQKCGAQTRKGTPCRCKPLPGKRRCKFHGGASTGPKTPEGRERIAEAQRKRWAARRLGQSEKWGGAR